MSKFKVGDKVRVKGNLVGGTQYDNLYFNELMNEYNGRTFTLDHVCDNGAYYLKGCRRWRFNDAMLESAEDNAEENVKVTSDEILNVFFVTDGKITLCFRDFGMSSTHPNDTYDEEMGKALAYFRLMGGVVNE